MEKKIAVLAGDGIGPEVVTEAVKVLRAIEERFGHSFEYLDGLIGGAAFDETGVHLPDSTVELCKGVDAILLGSVGGPLEEAELPKWKGCEVNALLGIRKAFKFNANFRPARVYPQLRRICPLKDEVIGDGVDLLIVRELSGDIYFGEKRTEERDGQKVAIDIAEYDEDTVRAIAIAGFEAAKKRRGKLHSVDKANVLETSRLWRAVVKEVSQDYPEIEYKDLLVDNCAMQIISNPGQFDVIVTGNLFGDILSDAAAVLPGSLGLTPSASLNREGFGLYEPSGGSAPDIAGKGVANPVAQILSAAMLLRFSFGLTEEATAIEQAVEDSLENGIRTGDIQEEGGTPASTGEVGDYIVKRIQGV